MRMFAIALVLLGSSLLSGVAKADADDMKWVAKCLTDNATAPVGLEIVTKYCTCMNGKMDANETQSISQWEKTHQAEMKACEAEAGWK